MAMTQPEETTAALIARLHEQLAESNRERDRATNERWEWHARAQKTELERDEQRARAEKAERERDEATRRASDNAAAMNHFAGQANAAERDRDAARAVALDLIAQRDAAECRANQLAANFATIDRLLVERTKERDEARERIARALVREEGLIRTEAAVIKERDDAREQLAKLEWAARTKYERLPECGLCGGTKPSDDARRLLCESSIGHRPTCWFAKKDTVNGTITHPTMGELKVEFPRNPKNGDTITVSMPLRPSMSLEQGADGIYRLIPARPEPRFKVGEEVVHERGNGEVCGMFWSQADGWQYQLRSEQPLGIGWPRESSLKPAPKFNVGDMVCSDQREPWRVTHRDWTAKGGDPGWYYGDPCGLWVRESAIKPAPKFAVGEWVTFDGYTGEVKSYNWGLSSRTEWIYQVLSAGVSGEPCHQWRRGEHALTAQTPQHKHDCKGCVFLGRMGEDDDLYLCRTEAAYKWRHEGEVHVYPLTSMSMWATEARRRAVARGLVK